MRSPSSDVGRDLAWAFLQVSRCGRSASSALWSPAPEVVRVSARRAGCGVVAGCVPDTEVVSGVRLSAMLYHSHCGCGDVGRL